MSRAYLIAGAGGMLGTALQRVIAARGDTLCAPTEGGFDITDPAAVERTVEEFLGKLPGDAQGVLVNAAAYTNVERAEDEPARAYAVNATGAENLAHAAWRASLGFVHVSTDFVFSGFKDGAYCETDEPEPLSVYGASKLEGEQAVVAAYPGALTVRTAWVFGPGGANFPAKILSAAEKNPVLRVVTDETGSPTYTLELAAGILGLVDAHAAGLYHLAGAGSCTRFELAEEVLRLAGVQTSLVPVTSDSFPSKAVRPHNSVLDCSKAASLGVEMRDWHASLADYVTSIAR